MSKKFLPIYKLKESGEKEAFVWGFVYQKRILEEQNIAYFDISDFTGELRVVVFDVDEKIKNIDIGTPLEVFGYTRLWRDNFELVANYVKEIRFLDELLHRALNVKNVEKMERKMKGVENEGRIDEL